MSNGLDLAIATQVTGFNTPAAGQEGYCVLVANSLAPGQLFQYVPCTVQALSFADHAAREADATVYVTAQLGTVARVTSDGTLWQLAATTPRWALMGGTEVVTNDSNVLAAGNQTTDFTLEDGFAYELAFQIIADDGSTGVEYRETHMALVNRDGTAAVDATAISQTNFATSWSAGVTATGNDIRLTVTNGTASARDVKTAVSVTDVRSIT